jgi:hypothetical protein
MSAFVYFYSSWVQTVYYRCIESNPSACLLKANVKPSQRLSNTPYVAWTAVERASGTIYLQHIVHVWQGKKYDIDIKIVVV